MKGTGLAIYVAVLVVTASTAAAQTTPAAVVRPDVAATIGWLNVNTNEIDFYNDWSNRGVQGALMFGWYWSPHMKSEVEVSASTRTDFDGSSEQRINGLQAFVHSEFDFRTRRVTLGHQYQFGENAWFHPHVGGGVDFNWETTERRDLETYLYDPSARQTRLIREPVIHPDRTDLHVRPFAAVGFKAYVTQRGFFRTDMRVVAGRRIEEVLVRFGVGVDF
jgi:hypothetical protein